MPEWYIISPSSSDLVILVEELHDPALDNEEQMLDVQPRHPNRDNEVLNTSVAVWYICA